jgi:hypothetical protein
MALFGTALLSGLGGAAGTGAVLGIGTASIAWPVSNFGGYAAAQMLFGGGPAMSSLIASLGGPLIAGSLFAGVIGIICAALGAVGYLVFS